MVCIYNSLQDVSEIIKGRSSIGTCIFVTTTTETAVAKNQWDRLAMTLIPLARNGTKLVCVCGPKGEKAWDENRRSAAEMFDLIREASATMKSNIVTQYGQVPAMTEPFATMGSIPRNSCEEAYSTVLTKEFLGNLEEYVAGHTHQKLFDMFQNVVDRRSAYLQGRRDRSSRNERMEHGDQSRRGKHSNGYGNFRGNNKRGRGRWVFKPY